MEACCISKHLIMEPLKQDWQNLITSFSHNENLNAVLFEEIRTKYTHKSRSYHNLSHIKSMLDQVSLFETQIENPDLLKFSIWYHDLIYNPLGKDNERRSAGRAKEVLTKLSLNPDSIQKCYHQIQITQHHQAAKDATLDEKFLIDFDLEILSRDWPQYKIYMEQIRKEYWMYPTFLYKKGRKDAMAIFLERPTIYFTEYFRREKEELARGNMRREIEMLNK